MLWLDTGEELSGGRAPPLGPSEELVCTTAEHQLAAGSGVLLYTDGVTEARHNGDQFGQPRLAQILKALKGQAPSEVVAVTTEVKQLPLPAWPTTCASSRRASARLIGTRAACAHR